MKYSTTSLSAITLCVWMMLSHHTNGMDMRGAPSSSSNNNPSQMPMTGQPWNQQPNTNMQSGINNLNNAARPILPVPPSNNQGQAQPPEKMTIRAILDPITKDLYATFSGKYRFRPLEWSGNAKVIHYDLKSTRHSMNAMVTCYRNNNRYEKVKAFYDHIEGITDPVYKKKFDTILLKRIDNAQSANKEVGCFAFERSQEYISLKSFTERPRTFSLSKHIPNMIAQIMKAVSYLNEVGVAYNSVGINHVLVSVDDKNNINGIKLLHFDRSVIFKEFGASMARSELYQDQKMLNAIYKAFLIDVKQTSVFIEKFFTSYGNLLIPYHEITDSALLPQVELYHEQCLRLENIGKFMKFAGTPLMMLNFMFGYDYNKIVESPVKE